MRTNSTVGLDDVDRRIIRELQLNGRMAYSDLAERLHLSLTPCWRRVRALESAGIITGYTCHIDPRKIGLAIEVLVHVKLGEHSVLAAARFAEAVEAIPEVSQCLSLAGPFDAQLRVHVSDLASYEQVLMHKIMSIPNVTQVSSSFRLKNMLNRRFIPV